MTFQTPDSISSYSISGISFGPQGGGISDVPSTIDTFQPFHIDMQLPFSMRQSEKLHLIIEVFNYMDVSFDAAMIIFNDLIDPKFVIVDNVDLEWICKLR